MQCGMVGLGRMGANMARRLLRGGHEVVVTNRSPEPVEELTAEGASGARTVGELVERLQVPRAIWMSLPAGEVTENTLKQLAPLLARGDVIVESGNSFYGIPSGEPSGWLKPGSTCSIRARAAASGDSRSATA